MDNLMSMKIERQKELEAESLNMGITRYRRNRSTKDESDLKPGQELVNRTLDHLTDAIIEEVAAIDAGKARRGRPSIYGEYLKLITPESAAFITAKVCINQCTQMNARFTSVALSIGTLIEEHLVFSDLRQTQPALFNSAQQKVKRASTKHHKRYTMRHAVGVASELHETVTGLEWDEKAKVALGAKLIEMFIDVTGLAEVIMIKVGRKRNNVLRATEATSEWINKSHAKCELLAPIYMPMIVPPAQWTNPLDGGYLTKRARCKLVKAKRQATLDELFSTDMPAVYDAVNILQDTPWRINKPILDVINELVESGSTLGDLPSLDSIHFPAKLSNMDKHASQQSPEFKQWKHDTAQAHAMLAGQRSRSVALASQLFVANKMRDEDEIFFPYQLDFRGRIYAMPTALNPQVDDRGKAFIEFANGKPLGEYGAYWLAVHIANLFGEDKVSLDDRVKWVEDNEEAILDSALLPLDGNRFWADADKPFSALAACFEWAGFRMQGESYVSHLPIAMDGTCSGLQHYSALLRDPIGGSAVNLVPQETPADIYSRVAVAVSEACASGGAGELGALWQGKITRKIVKQPCMTYAYSSTVVGMRDQIIAALKKEHETDALEGHEYFPAAQYLAPIVREEIENCVVAASAAMKWLQDCSRLCSELNQPVVWSTPLGLPVLQSNMKSKARQTNIVFQGQRMRISLAHETKKVDSRSQTNGIAPNYIHSLDSSHLMATVLGAYDEGITDFAMIHDSFGTHACDTGRLNAVLRQEFVDMYSVNLLDKFRQELLAQLPEGTDVPPVPAMGTLDMDSVLDSEFFFS